VSGPRVSVVMGVHNGERFLAEAIDSILHQTFADFEFIIIDDGSTDHTDDILARSSDRRLRIFRQSNVGLTRSLNRGLGLARGEYLARMDADDVAHPGRFEAQVGFLETHPNVVAVGTGYRQADLTRGHARDVVPPLDNASIRRAMIAGNPLCHPSVMMRKAALDAVGGYDESFRYSQDYELWSRLAQVGQLANLPDILLTRRYHEHSVSNNFRTEVERLILFMRANRAAIIHLGLPAYYQLRVLKSLVFIPIDLYQFIRYRLHKVFPHA
jgi:glycosyltransferase involved in cell wall biosynthesis